jgi:hypothetical protein
MFATDPTQATVESDSLGAWVQLDWRTFGYTNVAVISDLAGNLVGFFRVRGVYKLDSSGDTYQGHSYYEFLDTHHQTIDKPAPPGWVCNNGMRITVEAPPNELPPLCAPPE